MLEIALLFLQFNHCPAEPMEKTHGVLPLAKLPKQKNIGLQSDVFLLLILGRIGRPTCRLGGGRSIH